MNTERLNSMINDQELLVAVTAEAIEWLSRVKGVDKFEIAQAFADGHELVTLRVAEYVAGAMKALAEL